MRLAMRWGILGLAVAFAIAGNEAQAGSMGSIAPWTPAASPDPTSPYQATSPNGSFVTWKYPDALLRQADGSYLDVGNLGFTGGSHSEPYGVNDQGTVVGFSRVNLRDNHAFVSYQDSSSDSGRQIVNLGTLGGKNSSATAVNAGGTVIGQADNGQWGAHAFAVTPNGYASHNGYYSPQLQDLGTLGGKNSTAFAISSNGQVVGASNIRDDQSQFVSNTQFGSGEAVHGFLYNNGIMKDLGTIAGFKTSVAVGLNNAGQVVGYVTNNPSYLYHLYTSGSASDAHAFLYSDGKMTDINELLPKGSGWLLEYAQSISDSDVIRGTGIYQGKEQGYEFSLSSDTAQAAPIPEPSTLVLFAVIAAGIFAKRRVRSRPR